MRNSSIFIISLIIFTLNSSILFGQNDYVLAHINVIDVKTGIIEKNMSVLIKGDSIAAIYKTESKTTSIKAIDCSNKYLIPGLWDMHVHLSFTRESAIPILLAYGITGVRDMASDLNEINQWRTKINQGIMEGPKIIYAGPSLNGKSFNKYQLEVGNPEQARGVVRTLKWAGVDFIKVHRRVPRESWLAITEEAKKQNLLVVGHIPMTVTPEEASDSGQLIEHEETLFEGTFSVNMDPDRLSAAINEFRRNKADSLFSRFLKNGTSLTSTLYSWKYIIEHPDSTFMLDPLMKYVAQSVKQEALRSQVLPPSTIIQLKQLYDEYFEILKSINNAGVTILAGTDLAGARIPGYFLHQELSLLVSAGLTPLQALQSATLNPGKFLSRMKKSDSRIGVIKSGNYADLVILDNNPLINIENTQ